jgi:hypothetical protein
MASQWLGPTQVNALWRDRTAYRSPACPTFLIRPLLSPHYS